MCFRRRAAVCFFTPAAGRMDMPAYSLADSQALLILRSVWEYLTCTNIQESMEFRKKPENILE